MDKNEKILIKLKDWDYTCADECCHSYGTDIYLNNEKISDTGYEGLDVKESLKVILARLGYINVEIETD